MSIKGKWKENTGWHNFSSILFGVLGVFLLVFGLSILSDYSKTYEGKAFFATEVGYGEFKEVLASPDIEVDDIQVLSSEPTLVLYTVVVPKTSDFPYGKLLTPTVNGFGIFGICMGLFLLGGSAFVFFGED